MKSGLYFFSHEANIDKRTSLTLNEGKPYTLHSEDIFTLEFDLYLRNETIKFGYIFRIISDLNENFDFIINNNEEKFFVINKADFPIRSEQSITEKYCKVRVSFDKRQNEIRLDMEGETIICPYEKLNKTSSLLINFGECAWKGFSTNDVPPVILKDIIVKYNGNPHHYWKLDKHSTNSVYDDIKKKAAFVKNPYWLKDNSVYWKKRGSMKTKSYPQITFDSIHNELLTLTDTACLSFSLTDNSQSFIPMTKNIPLDMHVNFFLYNSLNQQIMSYNLNPRRLNYWNPATESWDEYVEEPADYAHHNRYISPKDSSLIIFGGYGHYKYKSEILKVNLNSGRWESTDLSHTITPRYLAAMGGNKDGSKIYILGGRGAEMGRQELSPKNFFELFEINTDSLNKPKKLFEVSNQDIDNDYVFSNSLVVDDKEEYLYVLAYSNASYASHIILKRLNLKNQEIETYGDTIDFHFHDISSFCDLYYSPSLSQLVAVIASEAENKSYADVNIYTLNFPPLKEEEVLQAEPRISFFATHWKSVILILILIGLISGSIYYIKKKKLLTPVKRRLLPLQETGHSTEDINWAPKEKLYARNERAILFLGGFQVFDKEGKNITGEFTPTLKFLLVLIILYTLKDGKGISSIKLQEFLWADKTEDAARNNRNVNIRKLRMLLETVDEISISNKNSYWTITFPDSAFSDYKEALTLLEKSKGSQFNNPEILERLLELLSSGDILPNIQFEWIDNFKSDFSSQVIDCLLHYLNSKNETIATNLSIRLKIAETILTYDSINEDAIAIKCQVLYHVGKKGLAKSVYNNFIRDYKALLGEVYSKTLKNLLEKDDIEGIH